MKVKCVRCGQEEEQEQALTQGWTVAQKAAGAKGELFVMCQRCRAERQMPMPTATLDVKEAVPFREAEQQTRRKRSAKK